MRDLETISTAITAAETGHLVFGTLHTKGAAGTIDRIVDVFPPEQQEQIRIQLAEVLECIVCQTLVPRTMGGRIAAFEILTGTSAVRNLIRQNKSYQLISTMQTSRNQGMMLMDDSLGELVRSGEVRLDDAAAKAADRKRFRSLSSDKTANPALNFTRDFLCFHSQFSATLRSVHCILLCFPYNRTQGR